MPAIVHPPLFCSKLEDTGSSQAQRETKNVCDSCSIHCALVILEPPLTDKSVCFPRASLAVGQDTGVESVEHGVEGRDESLEDILLGRLGPEYSIVCARYGLVWLFRIPNRHTCSPFVGLDHLSTFCRGSTPASDED